MSLAFLLDEDISPRVADGLRRAAIDAASVHELGRGNLGIADAEQLAFAAASGRVLVTYNRADFQALDEAWRLRGQSHCGILWCSERSIPRRAIGELVRALAAAAVTCESMEGLCLPLLRPKA